LASVQIAGNVKGTLQFPQAQPVNTKSRNTVMNKEQVNGAAKDIVGKVQEEVGKITDNKEQQVEGLNKQISGKAEKTLGDVKEVLKDAIKGD
jgi:uncharacterized protein YjbJ (UPF0337 family)